MWKQDVLTWGCHGQFQGLPWKPANQQAIELNDLHCLFNSSSPVRLGKLSTANLFSASCVFTRDIKQQNRHHFGQRMAYQIYISRSPTFKTASLELTGTKPVSTRPESINTRLPRTVNLSSSHHVLVSFCEIITTIPSSLETSTKVRTSLVALTPTYVSSPYNCC